MRTAIEDAARKVLNDYLDREREMREEIQKLTGELRIKRQVISDLASVLGEKIDFPAENESEAPPLEFSDNRTDEKMRLHGFIETRPDKYFGMSQTDAAAKFLEELGHASPTDQILESLK